MPPVNDLEQRLAWALSNPEAVARLAVQGQQRVQELFTWERVVDQLEALYTRVRSAQKQRVPEALSDVKGKLLPS